jgi:hypothetical protein
MKVLIRCNDRKWPVHVCNLRTQQIEHWLYEHVGRRWYEWGWDDEFGSVKVPEGEIAVLFKLKFGI